MAFIFIAVLVASPAKAESVNDETFHCPVNAGCLLKQLSAMESRPPYPSSD